MAEVSGGAAASSTRNLWELSQQEINALNRETLNAINCTDQKREKL